MVTQPTTPTLNRDEFASLQAIGKAMHRSIPPAHRDLLIAFGYGAVIDGSLRLTDAGRKRLADGK
jgi:hypothetical protein